MENFKEVLTVAPIVIAAASALSAGLGLHKYDGIIGAIGKFIDLLALNFGNAENKNSK